ncbi:VOC family protein [Bacillus solitudinis]|uniref:VOC family protein n=1 Tax=Bacillus solitudinis TaxID=2014074 RepID=UPI0012FD0CD4|nr:VOC family protein [Bacillus solitudinis]
MQTKLLHVRANVKDLILAREWYTNILGFKVSAIYPSDKPNYLHFEHTDGAIFAIMEGEDYPSHGRFNFNVSDVEELWNQLRDKVDVVEELFSTPYGTRKFTIRDIDGNELGFVQDN